MKAVRDGGHVDVSEWNLDVTSEAEAAFNGAFAEVIKDGVNQALECVLREENIIVFHEDGTFSLFIPLSTAELTTEPRFKFDLVANIAEQISFMTPNEADASDPDSEAAHLIKIRKSLRVALALLDKALDG